MKENVNKFLGSADECLARISVNGNDVFALAEARKLLKLAYDEINAPNAEKGEDE